MDIKILDAVLLVIVIVMIYSIVMRGVTEHWKPCNNCNFNGIPANGMVQLNPFVWPYSAFANPDSIYLPPGTVSAPKRTVPLTNLETPDHSILTN